MYLRVRHRGARVPGAICSVLRPYNLEAENLVYVQSTTTKESLGFKNTFRLTQKNGERGQSFYAEHSHSSLLEKNDWFS